MDLQVEPRVDDDEPGPLQAGVLEDVRDRWRDVLGLDDVVVLSRGGLVVRQAREPVCEIVAVRVRVPWIRPQVFDPVREPVAVGVLVPRVGIHVELEPLALLGVDESPDVPAVDLVPVRDPVTVHVVRGRTDGPTAQWAGGGRGLKLSPHEFCAQDFRERRR